MTKLTNSPVSRLDGSSTVSNLPTTEASDWRDRADQLVPALSERASRYDENDEFVADNYSELKSRGFFSAGVPESLGGGGASYNELCEVVRTLARGCSSTALALSMHYHLVAAMVWRLQHLDAPVADFLTRIVRERLVLVSSGGSDWLESSGKAETVEGGYRIHAHKVFSSGCLAGDLLMTSAVLDDPQAGPTVLHFPISMRSPQVRIATTWQTLGMRGTGSNDVIIEGAIVPAAAVSLRRPRGRWHPAMHLVAKVALPMIYSAYLGIAEAARALALREVQGKRSQPQIQLIAGEMENQLFTARLAQEQMVKLGSDAPPGPETTNSVLMARALLAQSAISAVEKAIELVGGRSFYRSLGLERLYRDVQAARFHPVPEKPQQELAGRLALGLTIEGVERQNPK